MSIYARSASQAIQPDQDLRKAVPTRRIDDTVPGYGEEITTTLGPFCVSTTDVILKPTSPLP
jgi:hypothetical protein